MRVYAKSVLSPLLTNFVLHLVVSVSVCLFGFMYLRYSLAALQTIGPRMANYCQTSLVYVITNGY